MTQTQLDAYRVKHPNCQFCGRTTHIAVHHIKFRSQGGTDEEDNLVSVCDSFYGCRSHDRGHGKIWKKDRRDKLVIDMIEPWEFRFIKEMDIE